MSFKHFTAALAATAALTGASAQAQTAAAPAAAVRHGPAIAGVCMLSPQDAIGGSTVGKFVATRLQQIAAQVNAELTAEKTGLDNEAKALDAQRSTLDQNTLQQRVTALQTKAEAYNRKAQQRDQELQATEQKALARIGNEMNPLVVTAYEAKSCSILFQRDAVMIGNSAMDLTPQVVTALNGKLTQFTFDRERLDQPAAAAK
jgi:outer membrane protein